MPAVQSAPTVSASSSLQQHVALANNKTSILAQQKENVTMASEVGGRAASMEVAMPTPTKPQNNNPLNIENLIATNTTSNTVTTLPTSSQAFEPSGHEQHTKSTDIQVATNFPTIFLAPGGMYPQTGATGLPFISMDPSLLGTVLVSSQLAAAQQANQAALLQQGGVKLTNEDVIKMIQAQASTSAVSSPAVGTTTENSADAPNAANMAMILQQQQRAAGIKPIYVVDNSDGAQQQLRNISGSNLIAMATTMDNGSNNASNSLSVQNSSSQIVPTPMNTDESSGQVMETVNNPVTNERRSIRTDISSVSEQVEDHFTRALGNKWQLTQKF